MFKEIEDLEKKKPKGKPIKKQKVRVAGAKQKLGEDLVEDEPVANEESDDDFELQLEVEHQDEEKEDTILVPDPTSEIVEEIEDELVEETSVVNPPVAHNLPTIKELEAEAEESAEGEVENSGDSDEEEEIPPRKSLRERKARKIMTYKELGKPSYSTSS